MPLILNSKNMNTFDIGDIADHTRTTVRFFYLTILLNWHELVLI